MKIRMVGNSILIGATALALAPQAAVAVAPNGQTTTSVVQVSKDVDRAAFVNRLTKTFKTMAASDSIETSAAGIQNLEAIQRPGIYGLIERISVPSFSGNSNNVSIMYDAPPQEGSIRTSQWCGERDGYTYVFQVTEKYMRLTPDGVVFGWVLTKNSQWMVTTCSGELA